MAISIKKSLYPLDRDPSNPMAGFNEWGAYIRSELDKMYFDNNPRIKYELLRNAQIKSARGQMFTLLEAKRILRNGNNN